MQKKAGSCYNEAHVKYVCSVLTEAFRAAELQNLAIKDKSIAIIIFYRAQADLYEDELKSLGVDGQITSAQRKLIDVRVTDDSHGLEAALVILDFTRTRGPGFTCDTRRLCLGITRAVHAEIVLMSRGVFLDQTVWPEDMSSKHDVVLLDKIYQVVATDGGVVILDGSEPADKPVGEQGYVMFENRCRNCGERGHYARDCLQALRCFNCQKPGHSSKVCKSLVVKRCHICWGSDHYSDHCSICRHCGEHHSRLNKDKVCAAWAHMNPIDKGSE